MLNSVRPLRFVFLALTLAAAGCHAQTATRVTVHDATKISAELARRIEVMIRSKSDLPPEYVISIGDPVDSGIPGFHQIAVTFTAEGKTSRPLTFLLSDDGKTLAQFNKFDISEDPKLKVSPAGRPPRGGPEDAPVTIVVFDDLECPYCAKMHAQMFPALLQRYKDQVRVVYRDFPLDFHPWAMHAAVDANCLASVSPAAYWSYVDTIHALAAQMGGGDDKTAAKAKESLDKIALDEGGKQKVNLDELNACIQKQDETKIKISVKEGEALGVDGTPALFINGERLSGAEPMELVYRMVDGALVAEGKTPPPPPPPAVASPQSAASAPAAKPGD